MPEEKREPRADGHIERIMACPHYHFDLEWFKPEAEYAGDMYLVLRMAHLLLKENPEFTFTLDQAWSLIPFFKKEPEAQADFRRWIEEGRVEFVGGTMAAPDQNMPAAENLVRQFLKGKAWARRELGCVPLTGWSADTFGHPSQMPQLLARSGFRYYAFMRGVIPWDAWHPLDFHWEGVDGSRVLAHWFGCTYIGFNQIGDNPAEHLDIYFREMFNRLAWEGERSAAAALMVPFGADFLRPRRDWFDFVQAWNRMCKPPLSFALPRDFFKYIEERNSDLPVTREELNSLFTGGYESRIEIKQRSRQASYMLLEAERWACLAALLGKRAFPAGDFERAWELLLKCDSHDTANGTGTDLVTHEAMLRYDEATSIAGRARWDALTALGARDEWGFGKGWALANSLAWERREPVAFPLPGEGEWHLIDDQGRVYPLQRDGAAGCAVLTAPSLGWRTYHLRQGGSDHVTELRVEGRSASNQFFDVVFGEHGIIHLEDRQTGRALLDTMDVEGGTLHVQEDVGNLWSNAVTDRDFSRHLKIKSGGWVEKGPVRATYEITGRHKDLDFTTRYTLWSQFPRLDCETEIDFHGKDRRVRVLFPLAVEGKASFTCETPYAATERPEGRWPVENWAAVDWEGTGLALLNAGNPSYQWANRILSFTLLRSVSKFSRAWLRWVFIRRALVRMCFKAAREAKKKGINHFETNIYPVHWMVMKWWASPGLKKYHHGAWTFIDQLKEALSIWQRSDAWERGTHTFRYSLVATGGDWRHENLPRRGWEYQTPLLILPWDAEPGERNHFYMKGRSLVLSALKPADDGDGLVVRVYDSLGKGGKVELVSPLLVGTAREILLTEDGDVGDAAGSPLEAVPVDGRLELELSPWEIKTLRITPRESGQGSLP